MTAKDKSTEPSEELPAPAEPSRTPRLTPAQEEEAIALAKELLLAGNADIPAAVEALVTFPWSVGVAAVTGTWAQLNPETQQQVIDSLAQQKTEGGKRLRLSIARGLVPIDAAAVEKITTEVCADMRSAGPLSAKDRMTFGNVFVGKGKPWLQNLKITEWAAPEALIDCAIDVCFGAPCLPFTQVSLLRWLAGMGRLEKLDEPALALIAKAVKRWNARFQNELRKEVSELPPVITEALTRKPEPAREEPKAEGSEAEAEETSGEEDSTGSALERMVASTRGERRTAPRERERRESGSGQGFDLGQTLRQIDAHVASLRRELQEAKSALRSREGGGRGRSARRESSAAPEENASDMEGLQRHNAQLEETIAELRHRLEDLASDHEDRAAAAHENEGRAQLIELLGLKLRESFAEFQALRSNSADEVVRQHFGDMLDTIFRVLEEEGVRLR